MTLSLVAVFIPLLFMKDVTGMLFREFSITLAVSIIVSGFVSLTFTPMLCSQYLTAHKKTDVKRKIFLLSFTKNPRLGFKHQNTTLASCFRCVVAHCHALSLSAHQSFPRRRSRLYLEFCADAKRHVQNRCESSIKQNSIESFKSIKRLIPSSL